MPTKTKCSFADNVICEREKVKECFDCPVWNMITDKVSQDLDICPVYGADRRVWFEMFGKEHVCCAGGE